MAGGHGGARPGAGRKKKAVKWGLPVAKAEQRIADRLPDLIDAMMELALGAKHEDAEGQVFKTLPDREAAKYLIDRIMGKPVSPFELEVQRLGDKDLLTELLEDADINEALAPLAGGST